MNQNRMNVVANNIANADKTGFKADEAIFKSFPEMLIHRTQEDGVGMVPMGSFDMAPIVGKLGMGVEFNESFTRFEQGAVKATGSKFDLMLDDQGRETEHPSFFMVLTERGERLSRSGAFTLDREGRIVNPQGLPLLGENGPINVQKYNFLVKENGEVWINAKIGTDPQAGVNETSNRWENPVLLDRIKLRTVEFPRELKKEGDSFYVDTPESGPPLEIPENRRPNVLQGYLEASNVNIVREMVAMIEVQRQYEANQKSISNHDNLLGRLINDVAR